ncbi:MAG: nucleoside kinase [Alistipes sp.]|nr:nucleoside kinase [Alistipes sp.]MBQ7952650.1 nucleoside kinase [Alistipes sp.]
MNNIIRVYCENTASHIEVEMGTSLRSLLNNLDITNSYPMLAAYVNNRLKELNYRVYTPISIRFIDITHFEGHRVYQRTVTFLLQRAMRELFPQHPFHIRHSLGSGVYCEAVGKQSFSYAECQQLEEAVRGIAAEDISIQRKKEPSADIIAKFEQAGYPDKATLLRSRPRLYSNVYYMGQTIGYFFGPLAPSSGYVDRFSICPYSEGFVVTMPDRSDPAKIGRVPNAEKMGGLFHQFHEWMDVVGVPTVGELNSRILQGDTSELIKIAEAVHGRQFSNIADKIFEAHRDRDVKVVLISGPSSSGKTTSAKRIGIQLRVLGLHPVLISLDDYFVNREDTPKDENGDYDYEALEALDLARLNDDLSRLIDGQSVEIPRYDFITGTRQWHEHPLQLTERSVLIMEGIHGLNPRLTPAIPDDKKFKIYLSCFTSVAMDNITRIHTTDNRLLRRITRDYRTRGNNAYDTIARWQSVRRGEDKHIFPYQENADVMVNTSLFYELGVIRPIVEPILREIPDTVPEFGEADRLLHFLDNFVPIKPDEIPLDSVLREFVGGSTFTY